MYTLLPIVITHEKQIELTIQTPCGFIFVGFEKGHVSYVRDQRIQKKYQLRKYIEDSWIQTQIKQLKDLSVHVSLLSQVSAETINLSFFHYKTLSPPFHQQIYFTFFPFELVCFFKLTDCSFYIKHEYQDVSINILFSADTYHALLQSVNKQLRKNF